MHASVLHVVVAILVLLATPAWACPAPTDQGVLQGTFVVGKSHTGCLNSGYDSVSGNGLGVPSVGAKTAYWQINTTTGLSGFYGGISITWCGTMTDSAPGMGASCYKHAGNGKGTISYSSHTAWVKFSWTTSAGGVIPVTGEATIDGNGAYPNGKKSHVKAPFAMVMRMDGGTSCFSKPTNGPGKGVGATNMNLVAAYQIG